MAEETGLIDALGRTVLIEALAQTARWERHGLPDDLWVSVNLSPLQVHLPGAVAQVADALAESGVAPRRLVLEITENLMLRDADAAVQTLHALRALGVRLALDDFGTGYSSLGQLRDLPVDIVKIAKPFIDSLDGRYENSAFAAAILALADNLRLTTLAEGVEHAVQMSELRRLGCRLGQGFHLGRPMGAAAVDAFLARCDGRVEALVPPSRGAHADDKRARAER
jgi:EAL domain-containing protein (putative c-di-GMP-specific phosphodiesterase class I)